MSIFECGKFIDLVNGNSACAGRLPGWEGETSFPSVIQRTCWAGMEPNERDMSEKAAGRLLLLTVQNLYPYLRLWTLLRALTAQRLAVASILVYSL